MGTNLLNKKLGLRSLATYNPSQVKNFMHGKKQVSAVYGANL